MDVDELMDLEARISRVETTMYTTLPAMAQALQTVRVKLTEILDTLNSQT